MLLDLNFPGRIVTYCSTGTVKLHYGEME